MCESVGGLGCARTVPRRHLHLLNLAATALFVLAALLTDTSVAGAAPAGDVNSELPWHAAVVDADGGLLAWHKPQQGLGYDEVLRLGWNFVEHQVPDETGTNLKTYLVNSVFDGTTGQGAYWQSNPAMTFGSFVDSALAWYPYSGDRTAIRTVGTMLDYMLSHGTTPTSWNWSGVPFPTGCGNQPDYGRCLSDMAKGYFGGIEPDKVGELGIGYALFYEMTGNPRYLDAAIRAADALATHVRPGNDSHTPWAFRIDGKTGATLDGESFGGIVVSPLRLFDELIRIHKGDVGAYIRARQMAWQWLSSHQLNPRSPTYDRWSGYFEDVPKDANNVNQAAPTYTALYLLNLPDPASVDPRWRTDVLHLISWVKEHFESGPFYGALGINEQGPASGRGYLCCSSAGLGSDTARWAAVNALSYDKTGNAQARENAFRSLNYATYFAAFNGAVSCCGQSFGPIQYWFSDGYSDYLRSFSWAMAAIPALAPAGESHLLGSTSVVQRITSGQDRITYRTYEAESTEVLRVAFQPRWIAAGGQVLHREPSLDSPGYTLESIGDGSFVLHVHHVHSHNVVVATDTPSCGSAPWSQWLLCLSAPS